MTTQVTTEPEPKTVTVSAPATDHSHDSTMWKLSLAALGVVYGDIGTSPLYALAESLKHMARIPGVKPEVAIRALHDWEMLGMLSIAVWTLVIVVVVKYLTIALRADNEGEGGILALLALLTGGWSAGREGDEPSKRKRRKIVVLGLLAGALLLADGMITPAISVLSAVEGIEKVGGESLQFLVIPVTLGILVFLFLIQKHGTGKLGGYFGPMMVVWFVSIAFCGTLAIFRHPGVLVALSPHYALQLITHDPKEAFFLLAAIVLVVTGAEALYADMGHFGRAPIRRAWYLVVFPCLLLNYFGQVAYALSLSEKDILNPEKLDTFWNIVPHGMGIAMTIIATLATIIASQALISGAYSLAQQAVQLGYAPRLRIVHTSAAMRGQIYVPFVNTILMFACLTLVVSFRTSSALASMYGLSVTGTMTITTILLYKVAREKWNWPIMVALPIMGIFLIVDLAFFTSNLNKLAEGGWVALCVASVFFVVMLDWFEGRNILARPIYSVNLPLQIFLEDMKREHLHRVPGMAVFMTSRSGVVPMVLMHHIKHNRVLHEKVILLAVQTLSMPHCPPERRLRLDDVGQGIWELTVSYGFMEEPDVPKALRECAAIGLTVDPDMVSYYLGRVSLRIVRGGPMGRLAKGLFGFLYHNERPATEFFNLPANRVVELGRQLEL